LLTQLEQQSSSSTQAKTKLEARANVLQKKTQRLLAALNSVEMPLLVTDMQDQVQYSNPAARELFGTGDENEIDLASVPKVKRLLTETRERNAATNRRTTEFELSQDDEVLDFRATSTIASGNGGSLIGVVTILEDIREERLAKTRHAEFVSSVAHELKTPMASIAAFIEMLIDGDFETEDEQQEIYGFIDIQVDRLTRLVNNMLNLARIESGVIKIQREDCELNDVLNKALSVVQPVAEEKQIAVVAELSDLYLAVHIDKDLFGQAIINLLSNAVKYTPSGGEVRLRSRLVEGKAVIDVRDTGMGIPEASLPHIFERFYRVPENNKAAAGTGLGLALVHYVLTDVHNGAIEVSSVVNEGTCFSATVAVGHRDPTEIKSATRSKDVCSV
jgi:two-component system phosphate regulon sensor histidine kinase PhoR